MKKINNRGYTIAELLIAISVSTIIVTVLSSMTMTMYRTMQVSKTTAELNSDSQLILHAIVDDTRLAGGLLSSNTITDTYAPQGFWTTNDPSNVLIINSPAVDSSSNVIYDTVTGTPYKNEVIYFGINNKLSRRTLKNDAATNNSAVTTCPSGTVNCRYDKEYTNNLKDLTFTFYDDNDQTTATAENARSVKLSVTLEKKASGKMISVTNTIRTTLRNR